MSEEVQGTVMSTYGLAASQCPVVLNGVDLTQCEPKTDYALHKPVRIIHVGRFSDRKITSA